MIIKASKGPHLFSFLSMRLDFNLIIKINLNKGSGSWRISISVDIGVELHHHYLHNQYISGGRPIINQQSFVNKTLHVLVHCYAESIQPREEFEKDTRQQPIGLKGLLLLHELDIHYQIKANDFFFHEPDISCKLFYLIIRIRVSETLETLIYQA